MDGRLTDVQDLHAGTRAVSLVVDVPADDVELLRRRAVSQKELASWVVQDVGVTASRYVWWCPNPPNPLSRVAFALPGTATHTAPGAPTLPAMAAAQPLKRGESMSGPSLQLTPPPSSDWRTCTLASRPPSWPPKM